jgi:hypothetical protein
LGQFLCRSDDGGHQADRDASFSSLNVREHVMAGPKFGQVILDLRKQEAVAAPSASATAAADPRATFVVIPEGISDTGDHIIVEYVFLLLHKTAKRESARTSTFSAFVNAW